MNFTELEALRRRLAELGVVHVKSLETYWDPGTKGFGHERGKPKLSKASTATCVLSLIAAGRYANKWRSYASELAHSLLESEWSSAKLPPKNPFTTAFVLETVTALERECCDLQLADNHRTSITEAEAILLNSLKDGREPGAAEIEDYPPSAYVTQLVVRVLWKRDKLRIGSDLWQSVRKWALTEIMRQLSLRIREHKMSDVFSLAYATIIVASISEAATSSPDEMNIVRTAVDELFAAQLKDGSWPPSRPLFHYPGVGSAYCYEYEMLVQLLQQARLRPQLLAHLDGLRRAALALDSSSFALGDGALGWASGHHPQLQGPESWSTASVFHFVHELDRLVAEAIRQELFRELDQEYHPPLEPKVSAAEFAAHLLDSEIAVGNGRSLKKVLWDSFVNPLASSASEVAAGRALPNGTAMSAIFFGPPGTSKTVLAHEIAAFLRWPLLTIDPSYLVRRGMDMIQAEANRIFDMLAASEQIVVLLDEFDEMVRDRLSANSEAVSRFLTTAMLPKLSRIHDRRRIVFILATNQIDQFDLAISRLGRFDCVVQVLPPTTQEKLRHWSDLATHFEKIQFNPQGAEKELSGLTFSEFKRLVPEILKTQTSQHAMQVIQEKARECTMERRVGEQEDEALAPTWRDRSEQQKRYIRV
jgi:hypothetical protein